MYKPLLGDVHGDLVEEVAGYKGGFVVLLDEANDAFMVDRNEEGKVSCSELGKSVRSDDQRGGALLLLYRALGR